MGTRGKLRPSGAFPSRAWERGSNKITAGGIGSVFTNTGAPNPQGIAFDSAGNLYVSSINNSTVERFSPTGVYLGAFVSSGLYRPYGLAFDKAGNLYVADLLFEKIEKITPSGVRSVFASAGLSHPYGLAFDSADNLYVSNLGNDTIMKFTPDGVGSVFASGLSDPGYLAFTDDAGVPLPLANGYPTPEPTSAVLLALSLPALLAFRRQRTA